MLDILRELVALHIEYNSLTQEQFAAKSGGIVSRNHVQRLLNHTAVNPSFDVVMGFGKALGISPVRLLCRLEVIDIDPAIVDLIEQYNQEADADKELISSAVRDLISLLDSRSHK